MTEIAEKAKFLDERFRDYACMYFELHANQRLKMFQFYITLSTAIMGGSLLLLRYGQEHKAIGLLWLFLLFLSFVFWKLDIRSRTLIRNAEEALKFLDAQYDLPDIDGAPHPLTLFLRDDHLTSKEGKRFPLRGHFSYSRSFEAMFLAVASVGVVAGCFGLYYFPL